MKYFEAIVHTQPICETANDILCALLAEIGFESFVNEEEVLKAYIQQQHFLEDSFKEVISEFPLADI